MPMAAAQTGPHPLVVVHAPRARTRAMLHRQLPRRHVRVVTTQRATAVEQVLRTALVDAVIVDLGSAASDSLGAVSLALHFPSAAFIVVTPFRSAHAEQIAAAVAAGASAVLADGPDDGLLASMVSAHGFTGRFTTALGEPPAPLALDTPLTIAAWRWMVQHVQQPLRSHDVARALSVTREHLSRSFACGAAASLKRIMDLVRLLAAAELAKNPACDEKDVARILGFSTAAQLSLMTQRQLSARLTSLSALRGVDVIERFMLASRS
ncbi:MAG: hypothetical protein ACREOJ_06155 [Gemmatimonadaceae bacterium]